MAIEGYMISYKAHRNINRALVALYGFYGFVLFLFGCYLLALL